jgi:hypothetical protein
MNCETINNNMDENGNKIIYARESDEKSDMNLETLINLKFTLEREISVLTETFNKTKDLKLVNSSADLDIYGLIAIYNNNILMNGNIFLEQQTDLLKSVDAALRVKCDHNWINDCIETAFSERHICYCSKCYIYK